MAARAWIASNRVSATFEAVSNAGIASRSFRLPTP